MTPITSQLIRITLGSIDAFDEGIQTFKTQAHGVEQAAAALIQVSSSNLVLSESKRIIDPFGPGLKRELELLDRGRP